MGGIGHHPGALPRRDDDVLPEPTSSHTTCLTARRACARCPFGQQSHLSGAPWNDGGRSFSTKERPADLTENGQKVSIFIKRRIFDGFPGAVLRTLCWLAHAIQKPLLFKALVSRRPIFMNLQTYYICHETFLFINLY